MDKQIIFFGKLGKNPELKYTKSQQAVCTFSVAIYQGKDKEPIWEQVSAWEELAISCSLNLKKGASVFVHGRKKNSTYTNKDGEVKNFGEIVAYNIGTKLL